MTDDFWLGFVCAIVLQLLVFFCLTFSDPSR